MWYCVTRWILPSVSKDHSAFIFRVKQINPENEGIIFLSNITNNSPDTASHPEDLDFYFTGQEGNMHSVLSHSLYIIHSSRNTYVTANGENVIPWLIFESAQKHMQEKWHHFTVHCSGNSLPMCNSSCSIKHSRASILMRWMNGK